MLIKFLLVAVVAKQICPGVCWNNLRVVLHGTRQCNRVERCGSNALRFTERFDKLCGVIDAKPKVLSFLRFFKL